MKKIVVSALFSLLLIGGFADKALAVESEPSEKTESSFIVFPEVDIDSVELETPAENDGSLLPLNPLLRAGSIS